MPAVRADGNSSRVSHAVERGIVLDAGDRIGGLASGKRTDGARRARHGFRRSGIGDRVRGLSKPCLSEKTPAEIECGVHGFSPNDIRRKRYLDVPSG